MRRDYLERFYAGETLALSRLMSQVEMGGDEAEALMTTLFPKMGRSYRIGVTGLTGAGKSTLVNALTRLYRADKKTVGVVAEDPTSPFSGGALLGDRVRMVDAIGDDGVFIRSIASRGNETGLSAGATELADVLDAFGRDIILLETIGIGQLEHKILYNAHTTLVVLTPDAGDDVQSLKSGLMEVGEIFVVNKSDRSNADRFADDLRSMLELRRGHDAWLPPVVTTVATDAAGTSELYDAITSHRKFLSEDNRMANKRAEALKARTMQITERKLKRLFWENEAIRQKLSGVLDEVALGKKSPHQAANEVVAPFRIDGDKNKS